MANREPAKTAPFVYFFAGVEGEKPESIPPAWQARFYVDGSPFPAYPKARAYPPGCTCRHLDSGPGGGPGLLASPFTLPVEQWGPTLSWPREVKPFAEVEVEPGVWLLVSPDFTPFDVMRSPVLAPVDIARVRCVTTRHAEPKHQWLIPCCLPQSPECVLPMVDHYERGSWRSVPRYEYTRIAGIADTIHAGQTGRGDKPDRDWIRMACCEAVAVNYEITAYELGALSALGDDFYNAAASLLIGVSALRE